MEKQNEQLDEQFIDLGSVTSETHGTGGPVEADANLNRLSTGILAD
ncbi:hypothetical protein [Novosphingobium sp. P6W]|nr:hypothetical protein [Novosphingobium sp. P6W]